MSDFLAHTLALVVLLLAARHQWGKVKADESPEARRERARDRVFREAETDDYRCAQCGEVSTTRRLVMLYDDAALCCEGCAALYTLTTRKAA